MKDHVTYGDMTFEPYIDRQTIAKRVRQLAQQINADLQASGESNPLFICVLNGAFPFASDLFRAYDDDAQITFVRLKSYDGTESTGNIRQMMGLQEDVTGRSVVIVEDIIDTGRTIQSLMSDLRGKGAKDVRVATLMYKPLSSVTGLRPDYVGFEIPSKFILGYGMDLDEKARNLPDIYILAEQNDHRPPLVPQP